MGHIQKNRTLLITGGTGYLGSRLLHLASGWDLHATFCTTHPPDLLTRSYHQCDLRRPDDIRRLVTCLQPSVIIHTACSNHTPHNLESIVPAATHVSLATSAHKIRLIHVSSDVVFDGDHAPYVEEDTPNPITQYGKLKAQAERLVSTQNPETLIVRTSLIYGASPLDHQSRWLLDGITKGKPVRLFTDEMRCPIWVDTLGLALLELAQKPDVGFLHVAGPQSLTRWDFGHAMLTLLREPHSPLLTPATIAESDLVRPQNLSLNVTKAQRLLQTPLLSIKEVTRLLHSKG